MVQTPKHVVYATDGIERADKTKILEGYYKSQNPAKGLDTAVMSAGRWQLCYRIKMQDIRDLFTALGR